MPLSVANPFLEARDAQAAGLVRINATARGSLAAPQLNGSVTLSGGTFVDPQFNIRLEGIALDAALEGNAALLRSFSANVASGGRITAQGRVTLNRAGGYPADLSGRIIDVRYTDGAFVSTRLSGELACKRTAHRRRRACSPAASISATPRSRSPRASAPAPRRRSTRSTTATRHGRCR